MSEKPKVYDEDGTEFAYYDEYPSEDPWLICPRCEGHGTIKFKDLDLFPCNFCNGSGKTK